MNQSGARAHVVMQALDEYLDARAEHTAIQQRKDVLPCNVETSFQTVLWKRGMLFNALEVIFRHLEKD